MVSFTKAAAQEMVQRCGVKPGANISTLHSFAFRLAGISRDQVLNDVWLKELSRVTNLKFGGEKHEIADMSVGQAYMSLYSLARARMTDDYREIFKGSPGIGKMYEFLYFVQAYEAFKQSYGVVDFTDMIEMAIGKNPGIKTLFVDEAQDLTPQQWTLIDSWIPYLDEIVVAGDDDQSIYKWGGADPSGMPDFERKFNADRVVLQQSFRVPASVHAVAERLIRNVSSRVPKTYLPRAGTGTVNWFNGLYSLPIPGGDTMILVRNHSMRAEVEEWLMRAGVAYDADGGPLKSRWANAMRVLVKYKQNINMTGHPMLGDKEWSVLERTCFPIHLQKVRMRSNFPTDWTSLLSVPKELRTYFEILIQKHGFLPESPSVRIMTIHASKGREADRVILINGRGQRTSESKDIDSEIRTFYVAVTRAKTTLDIVSGENSLKELR